MRTPELARVHEALATIAWERDPDAPMDEHLILMAKLLRDPAQYDEVMRRATTMPARPVIVCLCGSTRFWRDYQEMQDIETRGGKIVLTVGCFVHPDAFPQLGASPAIRREVSPEDKRKLDDLHLRKIEMADECIFLNRGGYMGESTRAELAHARKLRKRIRFLEPLKPEDREQEK